MTDRIHNCNYIKQTRTDLRKISTPEEIILWEKLRNNNLNFKFKRQHSIGNFIADFYCSAKKIVIELDGNQHLENKEYDKERTEYFESLGLKVVRFWNAEVNKNLDRVIENIKNSLL
jgi:very-short-patch-repair endonuclease